MTIGTGIGPEGQLIKHDGILYFCTRRVELDNFHGVHLESRSSTEILKPTRYWTIPEMQSFDALCKEVFA